MILQETVTIKINNKNIKHYESLGYIIPRYKNKCGSFFVKRGTKIEVKVSDLTKGSNVKVLCKCDLCGIERILQKNIYRNLCPICAKQSNEYKENQSQKHFGKHHPMWNPSLTDEERNFLNNRYGHPGYGKWKRLVKERDNYTCQKCRHIGKKNDGTLRVHHLNNYLHFENQRTDINNGITLCNSCHNKIHKIFGRFTTKENLEKFMNIPLEL